MLVVTDPGVRKAGLTRDAELSLEGAGYTLTIFDQVESDPSLDTVEACTSQGLDAEVTGALGLGGG